MSLDLSRAGVDAGVRIVTGIAAFELLSPKKSTEALVGLVIGLLLGTERETERL
jgi:hypothetical protein